MDPETYSPAPAPATRATPAARAAPKQKPKLRTLEDILNEFGDLDQVQFDPFQPEAHTEACANLPHSFPSQPEPIDYFNLFLTDDLWQTISTNTNRYTAF
jgi:hypothetical protein